MKTGKMRVKRSLTFPFPFHQTLLPLLLLLLLPLLRLRHHPRTAARPSSGFRFPSRIRHRLLPCAWLSEGGAQAERNVCPYLLTTFLSFFSFVFHILSRRFLVYSYLLSFVSSLLNFFFSFLLFLSWSWSVYSQGDD